MFSRTADRAVRALLSSIVSACGFLAWEARFALNQERVMSRNFLPKITLSVSGRLRLEQLIFAAEDHPAARFLPSEISRAEIIPDDSDELESIVTMGSSVKYRLNWGSAADTRTLVYPEECATDRSHVSVLSPLGAALIGLRAGSRMPYLTIREWMHVVEVESVSRSAPNVAPLFPLTRDAFASDGSGDDPGPSAA